MVLHRRRLNYAPIVAPIPALLLNSFLPFTRSRQLQKFWPSYFACKSAVPIKKCVGRKTLVSEGATQSEVKRYKGDEVSECGLTFNSILSSFLRIGQA